MARLRSEAIPLVIGTDHEITEHDVAKKKESINNELAVDHIYAQKFEYAASVAEQFKEAVDSYIEKMLNHLGIVFFKSQTFYSANSAAENDQTDGCDPHCVIEFHLFSIDCLGKKDEAKISSLVNEFLGGFEGHLVRLKSKDVLACNKTQLRKPAYTR